MGACLCGEGYEFDSGSPIITLSSQEGVNVNV
jgi:hypothetical protein